MMRAAIRAAAKNYNDVAIITSPNQYPELINELKINNGSTSIQFRKNMSQLAFGETAYYDAIISNYFNEISNTQFPQKKIVYGSKISEYILSKFQFFYW